jgi:superfamily I DNA and/or RNA helicase
MEASLKQYEKDVLEKLLQTVPVSNIEKGLEIFNNSIKLEWIDHIESKNPVLRMVSSLKMEQTEKELQEKIKEKLKLSKDILLLKIRERTYKNINYNRLNNMVTYRDLSHQVTKKKKIWPIRKLLSSYSQEVFELMPCWFASPESVSAIFPMESMFDLVIFDEASQCYAEKCIPALYRGKQVVIAGDDKQLSPSDLYHVRWDEEEDIPELEIDSLLDLTKKYIMQVGLMGHYRSRSPELINFSNSHFYNNKLKLLPESDVINQNEPAINYIKVNGVWDNNSNMEEAVRVVDLVEKYVIDKPEKSIGIVTFNFKQQTLIRDILEERALAKKFSLPESLFIKNIENVQGDERDIIIFSIAYAPDKNGRLAMHFGSLNAAKGENRLNVAITRAKYKIYIITSIMPDQMKVEATKNEGPKLLKEYLRYAWEISEGKHKNIKPSEDGYGLDWFLKKKIVQNYTSEDMVLEEELPFADLTVKTNKQYKGLIITDDDFYHQALSIKEYHAYNHLSLKEKKWETVKFFSRQYWENKEKINEKIKNKFKDAKD